MFLAWWEWRVTRKGSLVSLRKGGMWQPNWPVSLSLIGLTLWPNWSNCWLATLSVLSIQIQNPVGLLVPGHYSRQKNDFSISVIMQWMCVDHVEMDVIQRSWYIFILQLCSIESIWGPLSMLWDQEIWHEFNLGKGWGNWNYNDIGQYTIFKVMILCMKVPTIRRASHIRDPGFTF